MATFSVLLLTAAPPGQASLTGLGEGAFVKIDGREALLRSMELFLNRQEITQIQICFLPGDLEQAKKKYSAHLSFSGVKVISGGPRWIDQIAAAAGSIDPAIGHVLVHDAARPAVPHSDIDALLQQAEKHAAMVLAAPLPAALIEVDEGDNVLAVSPPARYMQLLTPQVFSKARFAQMATAKQEPHPSELHLLKGSGLNLRLGSAADVGLVKAMINLLPKSKTRAANNPFEEAQW